MRGDPIRIYRDIEGYRGISAGPCLPGATRLGTSGTECNHRSSVSVLCLSSGIGDSCLEISGQLSGHLWLAVLGPGTTFSPSLVRYTRILGPPWKSV